jgi:signal transduction histidine kinase
MMPGERSPRARTRNVGVETDDEIERLALRVAALEGEKAALEAERALLESFAAVAAHELVVPLVMTESYAAMVTERLAGHEHAETRADLRAMSRGAARARLLVEALLHDARSSSRPLQRRRVDAGALVQDCLALLAPELELRETRVEVGELPVVLGEEVLLRSVFVNLLFNALKYSPRQRSLIRVAALREPGEWRFVVESEGPTIPSEDRERIFEPFNRARAERRSRGAGLGLAIMRRIVDRHGGTVGITPANGGSGNRFYFTLPAA